MLKLSEYDVVRLVIENLRRLQEWSMDDVQTPASTFMVADDVHIARQLLSSDELTQQERAKLKKFNLRALRRKAALLKGKHFLWGIRNGVGGYPHHDREGLSELLRKERITLKDLDTNRVQLHADWEARLIRYGQQFVTYHRNGRLNEGKAFRSLYREVISTGLVSIEDPRLGLTPEEIHLFKSVPF